MPFRIYIKFQHAPATASGLVGLGVKLSDRLLRCRARKTAISMRYEVAACVKNSDTRRDDQAARTGAQSRNGLNLLVEDAQPRCREFLHSESE
jgi:hypothetical protein